MAERLDRVEELVRRELSAIVLEGVLRDPRLSDVTGFAITAAKVSADLASARIYVDVLDEGRRTEVVAALQAAAGRLQAMLGRRIRLKRTPRLRFVYDEALDRGRRIERLIEEVRGQDPGEDEPLGS
ncbi:MAG: 30S ribosome-binding factor RbfA [Deltaproteobacteria bacterium]|nr:MAG: 30S ribosome-binding factor RbfA [Deltaproteobacteria bacterium]